MTMTRKQWAELQSRAQQGDLDAQFQVGCYFEDGLKDQKGTLLARPNVRVAVHWYRQSAASGDVSAQINLGNCLSRGRGVKRDDVEALRWYKRALRQNAACAASNIATLYRDRGDHRRAFLWYQRAVVMGDGDAFVEVGKRWYKGIGITANAKKAVASFRKAIASRNITQWEKEEAMIHLAVAYFEGQGVRQSLNRSINWVLKANKDGDHPCARDLLDRIKNKKPKNPNNPVNPVKKNQGNTMRAKRCSKNQMTASTLILKPVNANPLSDVLEKLEARGITEKDVQAAVAWSRKKK